MTQNINLYKKYLEKKNLGTTTIQIYLWHVQQFLKWLDEKSLDKKNLKNYQVHLLEKYQKIASINLRLVILNNWLKFKKENFKFDLLTAEKQNIEVLDKNQLRKFLDAPLKNNGLLALRDKVLLELAYDTGLKIRELVNLKKDQINLEKNIIKIDKLEITLSETAKSHLLKYLEQRLDNNLYLFINFDRAKKETAEENHISIRSAERILEKYARGMQPILKITPQTLRHTLAYNLKREGGSATTIQQALHFATKTAAEEYFKKI